MRFSCACGVLIDGTSGSGVADPFREPLEPVVSWRDVLADGGVGVGDGAADLHLIAGLQAVGSAVDLQPLLAKLALLSSDRLGAGVQLIQMLVRGLRDHQGALACRRSWWAASST